MLDSKEVLFGILKKQQVEDLKVFLEEQKKSSSGKFKILGTSFQRLLSSRNANGDTPLLVAIKQKNILFVEELIKAGADVNQGMHVSYATTITPLFQAALQGSKDIVEKLIKANAKLNHEVRFNLDQHPDSTLYPIHVAIYYSHADVVDLLINAGADVNSPAFLLNPKNGLRHASFYAPLHYAAWVGNEIILTQLIEAKANINAFYLWGPPISRAIRSNEQKCIEILLDAGAGFDGVIENITADYLAKEGFKDKIIIGMKMGVTQPVPITRDTPCFENSITNVEEFVAAVIRGVTFDRPAILGQCDRILSNLIDDRKKIIKELREKLWFIPLQSDLQESSSDVLLRWKKLRELNREIFEFQQSPKGIDKDQKGRSLLPLLIKNNHEGGHDKLIKQLAHFFPRTVNQNGETIIHLLVATNVKKYFSLISDLVRTHHLKIDIRDTKELTPFQYLLNNLWSGNIEEALNFVIVLGANSESTNSEGKTLLQLLQQSNNQGRYDKEIVELENYISKKETHKRSYDRINDPEIDNLECINMTLKVLFKYILHGKEKLLTFSEPKIKITFAIAALHVYWLQKLTNEDRLQMLLTAALINLQNDPDLIFFPQTHGIIEKLMHVLQAKIYAPTIPLLPTPEENAIPVELYDCEHPLKLQSYLNFSGFFQPKPEERITETDSEFQVISQRTL